MHGEIDIACQYCEDRNLENLAKLVPKVVDTNAIVFIWDRNGQVIRQGSLLQIAAYCGAIECSKYLIDNKAEIDKVDEVNSKYFLVFFIFS